MLTTQHQQYGRTAMLSEHGRFSRITIDGREEWGVSFLPGEHEVGELITVRKADGRISSPIRIGRHVYTDHGAWNRNARKGRAYHQITRSTTPRMTSGNRHAGLHEGRPGYGCPDL